MTPTGEAEAEPPDGTEAEPTGPRWRWLPGRRLPVLLGLLALPAVLGGASWVATAAAVLLAVALSRHDARGAVERAPRVRRVPPRRWVAGLAEQVGLELQAGGAPVEGVVRDLPPPGWRTEAPVLSFALGPGERRTLRYEVRPPERGIDAFGEAWLRVEGRWGLGAAVLGVDLREPARVLPAVVASRQAARVVREAALREAGLRRLRRVGGGGEFEQLREYVPGDPYRAVDWKGTARRRWPVVRQYAEERSRTVVVVLEAGRGMARGRAGRTRLDEAIDAALLLAFVALRREDRVGLCVLGADVLALVPPGRGAAQYRRLLEALLPLRPVDAFAEPVQAARALRMRLSRRALLLWLGEPLEPAQAPEMERAAALLRDRHRLLALTFEDEVLAAALRAPPRDEEAVVLRAAAADVRRERELAAARLRRSGIELLEAPGPSLGPLAVERYLEIRRRGI